MPDRLLFLPGASGNTAFWSPVAERLHGAAGRVFWGWPGFGPTPAHPDVRGMDDLVAQVVASIDRPTAIVAQSMGGVVAIRVALQRPQLITHLVLTATSGGLDMGGLGAQDWRPAFLQANPMLPPWFTARQPDLQPDLAAVSAPTLLLWGDQDPISPIAVGQRLAHLLPHATLHVLAGGEHDLGHAMAPAVAPLISRHLGWGDPGCRSSALARA
jgi:pimeloyl-ACP methyl ester carboxylesterase